MYKLGNRPQHRFLWVVIGCFVMLAMLVATTLLLDSSFIVSAQGEVHAKTATPLPTPTNNGGSAQWAVNSNSFKSNYPKGFEFDLDVTSSGGKIVEATVAWSHAPGTIRHAKGIIDSN